MAIVGNLSVFSLPNILQMFERAGKTGQLSICAPAGIHRIWFYQGRVITAIIPKQEFALKQMLLLSGHLRPEAVNYLKSLSELNEPIGTSLKQRGLVKPSTLTLAFRKQIQVGVYQLLQLSKGKFWFLANAPLPYEEMTGLSKGGTDIAVEGLRQIETTNTVDENLPRPDSIFIRASQELPLLKLSSLEWSILENVTLEYKLCDLSQVLKADLLEVRKACRRLLQVGLLEEIMVVPVNPRNRPTKTPPSQKAASISRGYSSSNSPAIRSNPTATVVANDPQKTAINPNLLGRFASMLNGCNRSRSVA